MKVTIDRYRILHLVLLMACSFVLGEILIAKMGWAPLSAYGFACTVTSQISSAAREALANKDQKEEVDSAQKKREEKRGKVLEKRRGRRSGELAGAGKKKK